MKNIYLNDEKIIDILLKQLAQQQIKYLYIKESRELHILKNIYRFFIIQNNKKIKQNLNKVYDLKEGYNKSIDDMHKYKSYTRKRIK